MLGLSRFPLGIRRLGLAAFFAQFGTPRRGYSTMNVSGGGDAINVRRSSNEGEELFTANAIGGGSMETFVNADVNLYTSDFSLGVDGFTDTNGTSAAPITHSGESDCLSFTADAVNGVHGCAKNAILNADGSNVRFQCKIFIPSSNSVVDGARVWSGQFGDGVQVVSTLDQWVDVDFNITNDNGLNFVMWMLDGSSFSFSGADGDVVYLKNIIITQTTADGAVESWVNLGSDSHSNVSQSSATRQPLIVDDGVLETVGSDPAINFESVSAPVLFNFYDSDFILSTDFSIDVDFETGSDVSSIQTIWANRDASNVIGLMLWNGRLYFETALPSGSGGRVDGILANTRYKFTLVWESGDLAAVYLNGASQTITSGAGGIIGSATTGYFQIGGNQASTTRPLLAKLVSIFFYDSVLDAEHNIGFTNAY